MNKKDETIELAMSSTDYHKLVNDEIIKSSETTEVAGIKVQQGVTPNKDYKIVVTGKKAKL